MAAAKIARDAQMNKTIYLDNGSTTKVAPEVTKSMIPYFEEEYGNASTIHAKGVNAKQALENSRKIIAKSINALPEEIIFTSGGTESNNFALKGTAFENKEKRHIITTKIEHSSVLNTCKWLESQGFEVTYLSVDKDGFIDLNELKKSIKEKTILFSVIHANNEIGTIQNLEEIGKICKQKKIYFHIDACQSYTKVPIDVKKQNLDLVSLNAHKIHGPKGVGALYIKKATKISSWQHGGSHESHLRAGTENVSAIVGFAKAVQITNSSHIKKMTELRDKLISEVLKIPGTRLNGPQGDKRLCSNTDFSFNAIEGEAIVGFLDEAGIAASTGSACAEKNLDPSHVLKAIGLSHEQANGSLRLTLSRFTTEQEICYAIQTLPEIVKKLRQFSPFGRELKNVL